MLLSAKTTVPPKELMGFGVQYKDVDFRVSIVEVRSVSGTAVWAHQSVNSIK